ncbi:MAG: Holliday junction branch migration protein RuvA [Thermomicrobium sp.]|nr:Holliday junction branch migration protein RuvA [Thermomicrobium sp.]MCS7246273.1 Holliday junction branch migration protein RuvA [Thermomicrobium sp.]MDW7982272.1 Holliday junction branch migration protein RuvA [Thermomicrobium sp.]
MIRGLRGRLVQKRPGELFVDVHGVVFRVQTSATTVHQVGDIGETVSLLTHLVVREEELALYGFATEEELRLFLTLLGVSGVGPRGALSILSLAPPQRIAEWIREERVEQLARAPGIGRKTASRIVLELRGRLPAVAPSSSGEIDPDLLAALQSLGYSVQEARLAASHPDVQQAETLEQRILAALRRLAPS